MLARLYDHLTPPPAPPKVRLRERRHACGAYVRKVKGDRYQLRWWIEVEHGGSVNCGLYVTEWEAERARDRLAGECLKVPGRGKTALSLWLAMKPLIKKGIIPAGVLPKWVRARGDGGYESVAKRAGRVFACPGPFDTPEKAHTAMVEVLTTAFARPTPPARPRGELVSLVDLLPAA